MITTGCADILVRQMVALGMRKCFSVSGNQIMAVYDAAIDRGLQIIHTRHETATVHMADASGRLTHEPDRAIGCELLTTLQIEAIDGVWWEDLMPNASGNLA